LKSRRGFSLVEVVVAVGVFVAGVVAAVALLSQTTDSAGQCLSAAAAGRVAQSSAVLLRQLPWDEVVTRLNSEDEIFATRDGDLIGWFDEVAEAEAYFVMSLARVENLSPIGNDASAAYLALRLELRWPLRQDGAGRIAPKFQESLIRNVVVNR